MTVTRTDRDGRGGWDARDAMAGGPRPTRRPWSFTLVVAATLIAGALIGTAVRLRGIEPEWIGFLCDPGTGPWWCSLRKALIATFRAGMLGVPAVVLALGSLLLPAGVVCRVALVVAAVLGGSGLVLYNTTLASVAVVLVLIRAVRA